MDAGNTQNDTNTTTNTTKTRTWTDTKTIDMTLQHQGTECWGLFHGGLDFFPLTQQETEKIYDPTQIQLGFATGDGPYVAQSQKGYMTVGLGISDYSPYIDQVKEKCHCGTFTTEDTTLLVVIQKNILAHLVNITYQTCQKVYQKTPTRFHLRVNSKSEAQDSGSDSITTKKPEDTSRYVEIENFQQYLGNENLQGNSKFQVGVYNQDKSRCLAQVSQY